MAKWIVRRRGWLLIAATAFCAMAYSPSRRISYDRSVQSMFSPSDPVLQRYQKLIRTFGGNEIVLAVYEDKELFRADGSGIRRCRDISKRLTNVPGVKSVLSIGWPFGGFLENPDSKIARKFRELLEGYTHGDDDQTAAVACMLAPTADEVSRQDTIRQLRMIMLNLPDGLAPGMLAGEPVMVIDGFQYVEMDGFTLGVASTILLSLTILACFRSLRWIWISLLVVQATILFTKAILSASGLQLTLVSSMLTAVVTVIGVATVVHVIVRFRDARLAGHSASAALQQTVESLSAPIFWACCTDAVGFLALTVATVGPVRDYGIMMAIGSVAVMFSCVLIVPALAIWQNNRSFAPRLIVKRRLESNLTGLVAWAVCRQRTLLVAIVILLVVATSGVLRLRVETDFIKNFRSDTPIAKSYARVESRLGGAGVLDVILPAPPEMTWDYLQKVLHLEERLRTEVRLETSDGQSIHGLTKVLSLADVVVASSPLDLENVPTIIRDGLISAGILMLRSSMPDFFGAMHAQDPLSGGTYYFRLMLRAHEGQSSDAKRKLIRQVESICRQSFSEAEITGFFDLLTNLIHSVIRDQWIAFAIALVGIGTMMSVAFGRVDMAFAALIPNTLPILFVVGVAGWIGVRINLGVAMIAAVSMGLSVDSSIHYITSFRRARSAGQSVTDALEAAHGSVGRAIVFSTVSLIMGFAVLCTSRFIPTVYFGLLASLAMMGGLLGNLVLLPVLLKMVERSE